MLACTQPCQILKSSDPSKISTIFPCNVQAKRNGIILHQWSECEQVICLGKTSKCFIPFFLDVRAWDCWNKDDSYQDELTPMVTMYVIYMLKFQVMAVIGFASSAHTLHLTAAFLYMWLWKHSHVFISTWKLSLNKAST